MERSAMKIEGREMILIVMIGPCLAWSVLRIGSSWENDFRSHKRVVMIGMCGGPGGRVTVVLREEKVALMRKIMHRESSAMNQVSILCNFTL
jgi:hypothetical protein